MQTETLGTMTFDVWRRLPEAERARLRDTSELTRQLVGLEGARVEVVTTYGETRRFWVGRSTGWRPCHLEIHNTRSTGGAPAEREYSAVRVIRRSKWEG
jgi:hypothetical protein